MRLPSTSYIPREGPCQFPGHQQHRLFLLWSPLVEWTSYDEVCDQIERSISTASAVYYSGEAYANDTAHWLGSSSQPSACSFEPGTPEDLGIALQILGHTSTPFAVKGGGHTGNPGFSSTPGVQIALSRFNKTVYDASSNTAVIGAGLVWDQVYEVLQRSGVNVVGARVTGVGVAGLTLGGGYSWLTNQYGLTIDTVTAFELVLTNGTVRSVTESSHPELFFALKGGLNSFGVVTKFTLKTYPQSDVWGGAVICYEPSLRDRFIKATENFMKNNIDPKAAIIATLSYMSGDDDSERVVGPLYNALLFYDGPNQPKIFDEFAALGCATTTKTQSYYRFVTSTLSDLSPRKRGVFDTVSVLEYSDALLYAMANESKFWAEELTDAKFVAYNIEPFMPSLYKYNTTPSAFPASRTHAVFPSLIQFSWTEPSEDKKMHDAIRQSVATLQALANKEHPATANVSLYSNYAIFDTNVERIYGYENLEKMRKVKNEVDPNNVMGLTGGFKV